MCCTQHMIPSIHCVVQTKLIKNVVNVALDWAVFLHFIHNSLLSVAIVLMLIIIKAKLRPTRELPHNTD